MDNKTADMSRTRQTQLIITAILLVAIIAAGFWIKHEDDQAARTGDYFNCWTASCRSSAAHVAAMRMM